MTTLDTKPPTSTAPPSSAVETPVRPGRLKIPVFLQCVALALLAITPFLPTLRGDWFWDDEVNVANNLALRTTTGLLEIWSNPTASFQYYPLTYSLFWCEYQLFGARPWCYHAVSLLIHLINALAAWRLLVMCQVPWSWFAAVIFAVHPMQVETVGWISEQKNLLATFFALLALESRRRYEASRHRLWIVLGSVSFSLAMASKTAIVGLAAFSLFRDIIHPKARASAFTLLWLAIGVGMGGVTVWRETATSDRSLSPALTPAPLTIEAKTAMVGKNLWQYVRTFVWPVGLSPIPAHPQPQSDRWWDWVPLLAAGLLTLAFAFLDPPRRGPLTALLFSGAALGPALGAIPFQFHCHAYSADHFAYFALLGFASLLGMWVYWLRFWAAESARLWAAGALILVLLTTTWKQSVVFADGELVWRRTLEHNPQAWCAAVNLGSYLVESGRCLEAVPILEAGVRVRPEASSLYINLARANAELGRWNQAEAALHTALTFHSDRPDLWRGLGNIHSQQRNWTSAEAAYRQSIALDSTTSATHIALAGVLLQLGRSAEAVSHLEGLLLRQPEMTGIREALQSLRATTSTGTKTAP